MLRFSEEVMLLLLNDSGGKFVDVPAPSLDCALAGAVLMDLAMENRIDTDPQRLFVVGSDAGRRRSARPDARPHCRVRGHA